MNERLKTHSKTQKKSADLVSNKLRIGVFQRYQMKCKSVSKKSPRYISQALENGRENHCLTFCGEPLQQAQVLYALWLGANLQAKISRSFEPLENALAHVKNIIATPAV